MRNFKSFIVLLVVLAMGLSSRIAFATEDDQILAFFALAQSSEAEAENASDLREIEYFQLCADLYENVGLSCLMLQVCIKEMGTLIPALEKEQKNSESGYVSEMLSTRMNTVSNIAALAVLSAMEADMAYMKLVEWKGLPECQEEDIAICFTSMDETIEELNSAIDLMAELVESFNNAAGLLAEKFKY